MHVCVSVCVSVFADSTPSRSEKFSVCVGGLLLSACLCVCGLLLSGVTFEYCFCYFCFARNRSNGPEAQQDGCCRAYTCSTLRQRK